MNFSDVSIKQLRQNLDRREISATELARACLDGILKRNSDLNAFIAVTEEYALSAAKRAQSLIDSGSASALTGIPFGIKDNICTAGVRTTCASKMLEDFIPPYDAAVVERLNEQGAVMVGKLNMDEFAMGGSTQTGFFGGCKNPRDLSRVPGGSSGGSAAAVAAGLVPYALGSDTGGSIRQPSAYCGVTGIKPTYGAVSRYGLVAFGSSLDQIGVIANSAEDCALVLNEISFRDTRDATSANRVTKDYTENTGGGVKGLRVALPGQFYDGADSETVANLRKAAKFFEENGAVVSECEMETLKHAIPAYYLIACAEAASNLSRFDGVKYGLRGEGKSYEEQILNSRSNGFGAEVKRRILLGNYALSSGYYDAYYRKAQALRQKISREYADIFSGADLILTPTDPSTAYKIGSKESDPVQMYLADLCTVTVNIAGLPALSTPCGAGKDGLPVGMSLIGKRFGEADIFRAADLFEKSGTGAVAGAGGNPVC